MEARGNGSYYYRKRWDGRTCVSEYLGSGATAWLLAECDEERRQEEAQARVAELERRRPIETARQIVRGIARELRTVTAAVLIANGYHQHKRQWRRHMDPSETRQHPLAYGEMSPPPPAFAPPDPEEVKRGLAALDAALAIGDLPAKAKKGKAVEVASLLAERERRTAVRNVLKDYPCIWPHLRHRLSSGRMAMMEAVGCHPDTTTGAIVLKAMTAMRHDLEYEYAPMLEQLLIEQVVLSWFDLDIVQQQYAKGAMQNHTFTAGAYWSQRLSSAQQRHLRAIETLARVRRLSNVTPLQVNIGGQQVNVAGV